MRKVLVISPHYDDAVLCCGQFLAGRPDAVVCTVYGGFPKKPKKVTTPYDEKTGFANAEDAVAERRREDNRALALLKAEQRWLEFPDSQYGLKYTKKDLAIKIREAIRSDDYEFIVGPLGIGHPDHEVVSDALLSVRTNLPVYLWEDLPLRVIEPQLITERLSRLKIPKKLESPGTGEIADKIRALLCYKSQMGTGILDPYIMYVPERFWRIG